MQRYNDLTYAEHASVIIAKAAALAKEGSPFALITSLAIEGGAAREVGSLAVVDHNGAMTGEYHEPASVEPSSCCGHVFGSSSGKPP